MATAFQTPAESAPAAVILAEAPETRFATVEYNRWQRYPWEVRCYGQGAWTIGAGVACRYGNELVARRKAAVWIKTGVSPADQREVL